MTEGCYNVSTRQSGWLDTEQTVEKLSNIDVRSFSNGFNTSKRRRDMSFFGEDVIDFADSKIVNCASCGESFINDDEN